MTNTGCMYTETELLRLIRLVLASDRAAATAPQLEPYLLDTDQAAAYLGMSNRKLRYHLAHGDVPAYKDGKLTRFKRADLEAFADNLPAWEPA